MIKDTFEIFEWLNIENSIDTELLSEIVENAFVLMQSIIALRKKYKDVHKLPLYSINTDYDNLMIILEYIESEVLKFGKPVRVETSYTELSDREIEEIKADDEALTLSGFDDWLEEGLI